MESTNAREENTMDLPGTVERNGYHYPARTNGVGRIVEVIYVSYKARLDALLVSEEAISYARANHCPFSLAVCRIVR